MEATGCRLIRYPDSNSEFSIYDIADIHYLNRGMQKSILLRDVERIKQDPCSMWVLGGDYADWISPDDKRFDPEAFEEDFRVVDLTRLAVLTTKGILNFLGPIKSKCLGACIGNHEFTYMTRKSEMFVHDTLCAQLGVPNMKFSGWADLYFIHDKRAKGVSITVGEPPDKFTARLRFFIHHGAGAANTAGGKINRLKALVDMVDADLVMMSHVHEQFAKTSVRLRPNEGCTKIGHKATVGMVTGSYLRGYAPGYTSYSEVKAYLPAILGASRAIYNPSTMRLVVESGADGVGMRGDIE